MACRLGHRETPFVSFFEDDNGAAIVPAAIAEEDRVTILGERLFDYRDVLCAGDPAALAEAWRAVADTRFSLHVTAVRGVAAERWNFAGLLPFCLAPSIRVAQLAPEGLEANHRKLGRFSRRLRRQGIEWHTYDGRRSALLKWIYETKARQYRGSDDNIFADSTRSDFIVDAAALNPQSCEIFCYELGGKTIAALVTFRDEGVRRFYTVWFDPAWAKESPGQVLVYEATLDALRRGIDCDYMTGEQPHKLRLATSSETLYRVALPADKFRESIERISLPAAKAA